MTALEVAQLEDFRADVQSFLDAHLTPALRRAGRETVGTHSDIHACREWHTILYEKGWIAPAWPQEHGGTGWSPEQRTMFEAECAKRDAPILFAGGIRNVGPLLIELGTDAQREKYLHPILTGEDLWCQGFSEPGAGSDLAALALKARLDGEHYILNGAKIWTTGAHHANRMFCLVRTNRSDIRQEGISFLLVDMDTPGLSVNPIHTFTGLHELNLVQFDDVSVPRENIVGGENEGWDVAKVLMRHARASNTTGGHLHRAFRALRRACDTQGLVHLPRAVSALEIELDAFDRLELRSRQAMVAGVSEEQGRATASFLKVAATELQQRISEETMRIQGLTSMGVGEFGEQEPEHLGAGALASDCYFSLRAASIYSGTNEVHRNQLAAHITRKGPLLAGP